jgi:hypothetical protein
MTPGTYEFRLYVNNTYTRVATSPPITVTAQVGAQVRALNDLQICDPNCVDFTGRLTAQEGYTWFSSSGVYSPYQLVTSPTLSNFVAEAVGYGTTFSFPVTFNLAPGRRYALVVTTVDNVNPVLELFDEGVVTAAAP